MPHATPPTRTAPSPAASGGGSPATRVERAPPASARTGLDPDSPQGRAAARAMRTSHVFFLTRHLLPATEARIHAAMAAAAAELGTQVVFHPWEHEQDGDAAAVQAITAHVWAQPTAPLALVFIDRENGPTRSPAHLSAAFSFLARDTLAQKDGLESMGITDHALVAYTSLPDPADGGAEAVPLHQPAHSPVHPVQPHQGFMDRGSSRWMSPLPHAQHRPILSLARQQWTCAVHAAPDELAAVTSNVSAHPVIDLAPSSRDPARPVRPVPDEMRGGTASRACRALPAMEYLNNKAVVVFVLVRPPSGAPGGSLQYEEQRRQGNLQLVRRALIEGAREWMMPIVFVPWYGTTQTSTAHTHTHGHSLEPSYSSTSTDHTGSDDTWAAVVQAIREVHAKALRGGLVLAFLDPPALFDGTVRLVHTSPAPGGRTVRRASHPSVAAGPPTYAPWAAPSWPQRRPGRRSSSRERRALPPCESDQCGGRGEHHDVHELVTTHGRIPAKDVASAVGGVYGGAEDITNDLEYSGRVDYHRSPSPAPKNGYHGCCDGDADHDAHDRHADLEVHQEHDWPATTVPPHATQDQTMPPRFLP